MEEIRLLNKDEVGKLCRINPRTVLRWVREGRFPKPIKFGPKRNNRIFWNYPDLVKWLESTKEEY